MNHLKQLEQLFKDYEVAGLVEGNVEKIMSYFTTDITGVGLGDQGLVNSIEQIYNIMVTSIKPQCSATFELEFQDINIKMLSDTVATGYAKVLIHRHCDGEITHSGLIQSLTFVYQHDKWYISAFHASPLLLTKESLDAYPMKFADDLLSQMRRDVETEAFTLMNSRIAGGIICTYVTEKDFPICFANENAANLLAYSLDDFYAMYRNDPTGMLHPDDIESVYIQMVEGVATDKDFEMQFRLVRKDGKIIWVIEYVRQTITGDGRKMLIGVFTEITEIIELQQRLERQTALLEEQADELKEQQQALIAQTEALTISDSRFRIALEKTSNIIFDYDLASGNIVHSSVAKDSDDFVANITDARESLIIGGSVMEEYLSVLNDTFQEIQLGSPHCSCVIKVKLINGNEIWNNITMTGISNSEGKTVRAVGLIEDITKQKEAEIAYAREEQYRRAILADSLASYVVNFTTNILESCQTFDPRCVVAKTNEPYDDFIRNFTKALLTQADKKAFLATFLKSNVLRAFDDGISELKLEYCLHNLDGTQTWMQSILRLVVDFTTNEKKGFLYVTDIDLKKQSELDLTYKSERDSLTNLYNKNVIKSRIDERLSNADGWLSGVFMMLDIDYFKDINDTYGHPFGDSILTSVAGVLTHCFRESDLLGRIGGDEFCIFFCGVATKQRIEEVAQQICDDIYNILKPENGNPGTSCSIGIAICKHRHINTFQQLYSEADNALYQAKAIGRNGYSFFEETN